jgi:hypothetical protein
MIEIGRYFLYMWFYVLDVVVMSGGRLRSSDVTSSPLIPTSGFDMGHLQVMVSAYL